jgi:hypothetical protein
MYKMDWTQIILNLLKRNLINHGETGFLVELNNIKELKERILFLLKIGKKQENSVVKQEILLRKISVGKKVQKELRIFIMK